MRPWTSTLAALALAVGGGLLAAPAQAGTTPVLTFTASPPPSFGSVAVGSSLDQTFTLTNTGTSASAAIKVSLAPSGAFTIPAGGDKCTGVSLGWKKTCTITVRYTPAAAHANDTATLTASAKKPTLPASLTLSGSAALSAGCSDLDTNGYANTTDPGTVEPMNAGEIVRVTPSDGYVTFTALSLAELTNGISSPGTSTGPATYTIPSDGLYIFAMGAVDATGWVWSCS